MNKIIIGDSHAATLKGEYVKNIDQYNDHIVDIAPIGPGAIVRELIVTYETGRKGPTPLITNALSKSANKEVLIMLLFGGEIYNSMSTDTQKLEPFDFCMPDGAETVTDCQYIPYDMVYESMHNELRQLSQTITFIGKSGYNNICLMSTPPMHNSSKILKQKLKARYDEKGIDYKDIYIQSNELRKKLWTVNQTVIKDIAQELEVLYYSPPPETFSSDGTLIAECEHDGVHGNRKYAQQILKDIRVRF